MALNPCFAKKTDLSLNLEKGKEYRQVSITNAMVNQNVNGQKIEMIMTMGGTMIFLVKDVGENTYVMDVKYEKLSMALQMPQATMNYSSESQDTSQIVSKVLAAMINKSFEITMSKKGKVTDIKNMDDLWLSIIESLDKLPEAQKEQVKAQIMKAYGSDAFKGNMELLTAIYPEEPVGKGDKWEVNSELKSTMSAKITTKYELVELNAKYALFTGSSIIKTEDKDASVEQNGMPMKFDMNGSMQSTIKVDTKSGWILDANLNQVIEGDVTIKANPQMTKEMKMGMVMKNEMHITN